MKKLLTALTVLLGFSISVSAQTVDFETATEAVANMKIGWNLGNTLDSHDGSLSTVFTGWQQRETHWSEPITTPRVIKLMKQAGFNVIRVPVTWYPDMDDEGNVSAEWMQRVHEVVDYVINEGMYCLLNVHHDTGTTNGAWIKADNNNYTDNKERFEKLWQQIANEFINYGEKLLFEGYNEILDIYNSWNFASYKRPGGYDPTAAASAYQAVNAYAQSFVNAVRGTGGNNLYRNLVCNIYCGCEGTGSNWSTHLQDPAREMVMPTDIAANQITYQTQLQTTNQQITTSKHLAVQMHYYRELTDMKAALENVDNLMTNLNKLLADRLGVPVIIGEWGPRYATDAESKLYYNTLESDKILSFADYFVKETKKKGFLTIYWMGMSNKLARLWPYFNQPNLVRTVLKAYYGDDYEPDMSTIDKCNYDYTEVTFTNQWGEFYIYQGDALSLNDYSGIRVELAEPPTDDNILQIRGYGDPAGTDNMCSISFLKTEYSKTLNFYKDDGNPKFSGNLTRAVLVNRKELKYGEQVVKVKRAFLIRKDVQRKKRCSLVEIVVKSRI